MARICKESQVRTVAYMHGRFNEFHVGVSHSHFDYYLVWSEYFKEKLLSLNKYYRRNQIINTGHFRFSLSTSKKSLQPLKKGNIALIGESNLDYEEIIPFWLHIIRMGKYNVFFRGKPGANPSVEKFIGEQGIEILNSQAYFDFLLSNRISTVIGTHSTALMESWLVGVPSLALKSSYDYGAHLWEDGLVALCSDFSELESELDRLHSLSPDQLNQQARKLWNPQDENGNRRLFGALNELVLNV